MPILSLIRPVAALSLVIVGLTAGAGHALGSDESFDLRRRRPGAATALNAAAHVVAQTGGSPPVISPPEAPRGNGYA